MGILPLNRGDAVDAKDLTPETDAKFGNRLVAGALMLTLLFAVYLALRWPLGVSGEWWLPYRANPPGPARVLATLAAAGVFLAAAWLADGRRGGSRLRRGLFAAGLAVLYGVTLFAFGSCGPKGRAEFVAPLFKADAAGLFEREAARIEDAGDYLSTFPEKLRRYRENYEASVRVNNNPPGATMVFYAARRFSERRPGFAEGLARAFFGGEVANPVRVGATVLAGLVFLVGAAAAFVPAWLSAGELGARRAFFIAALGMLSGSAVLFVPGKDTLQLVFLVFIVFCAIRGRATRSWVWGGWLGVAAAAAFFFSPATAVAVVIAFAWWAFVAAGENEWRFTALFWTAAAGGLVVGFGVLWILWGYNSFAALLACYRNHAAFYEHFDRTYWKWALFNLFEFALFFGAPLSATAAAAVGELRPRAVGRRRAAFLAAAAVGVLLLLDIWGKNLGEVARLWVFFMPIAAIGALAALEERLDRRAFLSLSILQVISIMLLRVFVDVWRIEALFRELGLG